MNHLGDRRRKGNELDACCLAVFPGFQWQIHNWRNQPKRLENLILAGDQASWQLDRLVWTQAPLEKWQPLEEPSRWRPLFRRPLLWKLSITNPLLSLSVLCIGPESGFWCPRNLLLKKHPTRLKERDVPPNTLRTETTALALSAVYNGIGKAEVLYN